MTNFELGPFLNTFAGASVDNDLVTFDHDNCSFPGNIFQLLDKKGNCLSNGIFSSFLNIILLAGTKTSTNSREDPATNWINCPACQKIAAGCPEGIVTLSGSYLWKHEAEIERILSNATEKALAKNPFERIIRRHRDQDKLVIETTDRKLAEHLGRVLHKAHQGELHIAWDETPGACRVNWERTL